MNNLNLKTDGIAGVLSSMKIKFKILGPKLKSLRSVRFFLLVMVSPAFMVLIKYRPVKWSNSPVVFEA